MKQRIGEAGGEEMKHRGNGRPDFRLSVPRGGDIEKQTTFAACGQCSPWHISPGINTANSDRYTKLFCR